MMVQALLGLFSFCLVAWILSENRRALNWRVPLVGLLLQAIVGFAVLKFEILQQGFLWLNNAVTALQEATEKGTSLIFGFLGGAPLPFAEPYPGAAWVLAFRALPLILVMSAISALLFHFKILPLIVRGFAWVLSRSLGIGGAVGVSAAANVFVGMVEAPLFIRPYLLRLSRAELFMVMTCGLATIAGTMMAIYASIIGTVVPNALGHILSASVISAPAALLIARIMVPETRENHQTEAHDISSDTQADTAFEAIVNSTSSAITLIINIIAMLIVMVALVHLGNLILGALGIASLQNLLGYLFTPLAWLMGLSWGDAQAGGQLLGTRIVLTEFIAYLDMVKLDESSLSSSAKLIMAYALCGFASLPSLGIMIGGLTAMVPERRSEIVSLGFKSLIGATLATLMTGAVIAVLQ